MNMERIKVDAQRERVMTKSPLKWTLGFTKVPNVVIRDTRLDKKAFLLFVVLRMHQFTNTNHSFPSWKLLCKEARLGRGSVNKGIQLLESLQYLKVERRDGIVNKYYLL